MFPPIMPMHATPFENLTPKLDLIKLNNENWVLWSRNANAAWIELGVEYRIKQLCEGTYDNLKAQTLIMQSYIDEYQRQISHRSITF